MRAVRDPIQTMQRVKVGLIGLAAVVLLIAVASAIIGSASRERPVQTAGSAQPETVANMALDNAAAASNEPLAELGVTPAPANDSSVAP